LIFLITEVDITVGTIRQGVFGSKAKELLEVMNEDIYAQYMQIGLSKADIAKIKKGEDVYVWYDELNKIKRQFFSDEEVIKKYKLIN